MATNPLYDITYGLYVIGCWSGRRPAGCIVNTCFQVTSENPRLAICLNKNNFTLDCIKENPKFSISIISETTDPLTISSFGFRSARDVDKYADFGYEEVDGTPAVNGSFCGRLVVEAEKFVDCGTHDIVVCRLIASHAGKGVPMTYAYYHSVIKGSAPKNAPTFRSEDAPESPKEVPAGRRKFRCDVCGYVVETDTDLPDDFVCPICGMDRSHFVEI